MKYAIGKQYEPDDPFKAAARLHQSKYRANELQVDCDEYGNRLTETDAINLLNYYPGLNVRSALRNRYSSYSKVRDADMLRSEHVPFNFFAPLAADYSLAKHQVVSAFQIPCKAVLEILFEHVPEPRDHYLNDRTAFDVYIKYLNEENELSGVGVEVKYTEKGYRIGKTEKENVENKESNYWQVTRSSGLFIDDSNVTLAADSMRQVWRNHLLGLSMAQRRVLCIFAQKYTLRGIQNHLGPESNPNVESTFLRESHFPTQ